MGALEAAIRDGYVRQQSHPEWPDRLFILNYTEKAAYEGYWSHVTLTCRGLIYDAETREVLARPFAKFFNHGQEGMGYDLDAPILGAWDKADGSLGIGYERPDGVFALATRGSFVSEQAVQGTEFLHEAYGKQSWVGTPLFEIIYPDNRIVLDYHGFAGLVYLGRVDKETGALQPPAAMNVYTEGPPFPIRYAQPLPVATMREALSFPPRENAEGMVVWFNPTTAVKIKQDDYVALHKIVTGLSRKEVWRQMVAGTFDEWAAKLPDEFYHWADAVEEELSGDANDIVRWANARFGIVWHRVFGDETPRELTSDERRAFAMVAKDDEAKQYLFAQLDGRDIWPTALKSVEPKGDEK